MRCNRLHRQRLGTAPAPRYSTGAWLEGSKAQQWYTCAARHRLEYAEYRVAVHGHGPNPTRLPIPLLRCSRCRGEGHFIGFHAACQMQSCAHRRLARPDSSVLSIDINSGGSQCMGRTGYHQPGFKQENLSRSRQSSFANTAIGRISFGVRRPLASLSSSTKSRATSSTAFPAQSANQKVTIRTLSE
jgi:hypothetical protein